MTLTSTGERYVVHELLRADDEITPCSPPETMHSSECEGRDIRPGTDGLWRDVIGHESKRSVTVDAGPILHRGIFIVLCAISLDAKSTPIDPCIGYVFREAPPNSRKIVILGDTYDPMGIAPLCHSPSPSLLIHESTDAYIPATIDREAKRSQETVDSKVVQRGHSTPVMAGAFAKLIQAQNLVLNHIGCRFPAPQYSQRQKNTKALREAVLIEMERQADEAWGLGRAQVAVDYLKVDVRVLGQEPEPEQNSTLETSHSGEAPTGKLYTDSYEGQRGHRRRGRGGQRGNRDVSQGRGGESSDRGGHQGTKRRRQD